MKQIWNPMREIGTDMDPRAQAGHCLLSWRPDSTHQSEQAVLVALVEANETDVADSKGLLVTRTNPGLYFTAAIGINLTENQNLLSLQKNCVRIPSSSFAIFGALAICISDQ
jgi:hypothetical protein